jgi:hypothetical protein
MEESSSPPIYCEKTTSGDKTHRKLHMSKLIVGVIVAVTIVVVTSIVAGLVYFCLATNSIKMYQNIVKDGMRAVKQDIEIDTEKNTMIFHLSEDGIEPGTFAVLDYAKSLTGFYDPGNKKCYLIGGIQKDLPNPKAFKDILDANNSKSVNETLEYEVSHSYPVSDKSFLPASLRTSCAHIPVFWLQPVQEPNSSTGLAGRQKRDSLFLRCRRIYVNLRGRRIVEVKVFRCRGVRVCEGIGLPFRCEQWQREKGYEE